MDNLICIVDNFCVFVDKYVDNFGLMIVDQEYFVDNLRVITDIYRFLPFINDTFNQFGNKY